MNTATLSLVVILITGACSPADSPGGTYRLTGAWMLPGSNVETSDHEGLYELALGVAIDPIPYLAIYLSRDGTDESIYDGVVDAVVSDTEFDALRGVARAQLSLANLEVRSTLVLEEDGAATHRVNSLAVTSEGVVTEALAEDYVSEFGAVSFASALAYEIRGPSVLLARHSMRIPLGRLALRSHRETTERYFGSSELGSDETIANALPCVAIANAYNSSELAIALERTTTQAACREGLLRFAAALRNAFAVSYSELGDLSAEATGAFVVDSGGGSMDLTIFGQASIAPFAVELL